MHAGGPPADVDVPMEGIEMPPEWLVKATQEMRMEYPDDRFEIVDRPGRNGEKEWRMKCVDCPGKVSFSRPVRKLGWMIDGELAAV